MSDRILITGASGFLGRNLVRWLRSERPAWEAIGACRRPSRGGDPMLRGDLRRWDDALSLVKKARPRIIFHCAGTTLGAWPDLYEKHVAATAHLLEAARRESRGCEKIVVVGSAAEYGNVPAARQPIRESEPPRPLTPYAVSKSCQTAVAISFASLGLPVVVARLFNLLGAGMPDHFAAGHFAASVRAARGRSGATVRVGPLDGVRDFLPVESACEALAALARRGKRGGVYNVCSGEGVRTRDLLAGLIREAGVSVRVEEAGSGSPRTSVLRCVGSPEKIRKDTGWRPATDWRASLPDML